MSLVSTKIEEYVELVGVQGESFCLDIKKEHVVRETREIFEFFEGQGLFSDAEARLEQFKRLIVLADQSIDDAKRMKAATEFSAQMKDLMGKVLMNLPQRNHEELVKNLLSLAELLDRMGDVEVNDFEL